MKTKIMVTAGALIAAGALGATFAATSQATAPGKNGRIAYMVKDSTGHWQIWVADADLGGSKKLTHGHYDTGWAVWSPNGKRLVFDSNRTDHKPNDSHQVNDVFVMKTDGSGVKKLTHSKGVSGDAAWSPKGSPIAFESDRGNKKGFSAIYGIRPNGRGLRKLTHPRPPMSDYKPRFSPDGTQVVFTRERGTSDFGPAALFTMRLDGSHLHRLTPFSLHADDSDWSPDGKRIVFDGYPNPHAYGDIYAVNATGGSVVNLTQNPAGKAGSADPAWSPDGNKVLFLDNRVLNGVPRTGLATMKPDGSDRRFLSSKNFEAHQADWQSVAAASPAPKIAARTDSQLAKRLVVAYGDQSLAQYGNPDPGAVPAERWQCLARSGFSLTARSSSHFGGPHTEVSSVASILDTPAQARRYYHALVRTISECERQMWQDACSQPPGCAVGRPHAFAFPGFGDQSVRGRIPIAYSGPPDTSGFMFYNNDWVVTRKRRAVLADDFLAWDAWPSQGGAAALPSLLKEERHVVHREFVRAFRPEGP